MPAIQNALQRSRAQRATAHSVGLSLKSGAGIGGLLGDASAGFGGFGQMREQGANSKRYSLFRGWVYAAINAIAMEAAQQPVMLGRVAGSEKDKSSGPGGIKAHQRHKMPKGLRSKSAETELEILYDHPLLDWMERPNDIQSRWHFVYSFIANLCLTGWSYVVRDTREDGRVIFLSLPTTWVQPDHSKGPFSQFKIRNPRNPSAQDGTPLTREQVAFAYLPNPSDPLAALAPAQAQSNAIKIDEAIQTSQSAFFDNGIFPSVVVTVGTNPHPDAPAGSRQRLTPSQRRQVYAAIKKVSGGVANYGNPAIVDGLIEKIERLSATQNEMGWEKSEKAIRTRILSAFGVHPFILGEEMAGSYAQAYIVQDRFCKRVNTMLDLLSTMMTDFISDIIDVDSKFYLWWESCQAEDPQIVKSTWEAARQRHDVSQNEFRAYMGLPPDEDRNEAVIPTSNVQAVVNVAAQVASGVISVEQATGVLIGMGLSTEIAKQIATPPKRDAKQPQPETLESPEKPEDDGDDESDDGQVEDMEDGEQDAKG